MTERDISRRRVLRLIDAGGAAAGCSSGGGDGGGGRTDEPGDGGDGGGGDGEPTPTPTPVATLEGTAAVALETGPTAAVWGVYGGVMPYYTNIVEPLVRTDKELEPRPWLATDWERTRSGTR